ncbi:hypothetical protein FQR65_LT20414 [Abscondita terminalis]|nr:hypothetical protein FQR65_LT20414 [Abscondita terminalis]
MQDLSDKILRTPLEPVQTYSDDPLRMMRAIRFASTLNFKIEEKSLKAIKQEAKRIEIPSTGLSILEKTGLFDIILPEITALKGIEEKEGQTHKDNFYHTLEVVDNISVNTDNLWLRWAALLHDVGKAPTKKFTPEQGWSFHGHEFLGSKMVGKPHFPETLKLPLGA